MGYRPGTDGGAIRAMVLWNQLAAFPGGELWLNGLGFGVLCLWTFLVSTWLGRSGVAGAGAVALLEDGSLVVVERWRRVVRYAPGQSPEVLFPR